MAIQVNPLNDSGLTAAASARTPYMNLPLVDKSPEGSFLSAQANSLFERAKIQQGYAQQQTEQNIAQLQSNTNLTTSANRVNADLAMKQYDVQNQNQQNDLNRQNTMGVAQMNNATQQQQVNQQGQFQQGQLQNDQTKNALTYQQQQAQQQQEQQKIALQQQETAIHARALLDPEDRENRGAAAGALLGKIGDPNFSDNTAYMVQNGMMSAQEKQMLDNGTPAQRQIALSHDLLLTKHADDIVKNPQYLSQMGNIAGVGQGQNGSPGAAYAPVDPQNIKDNQKDITNGTDLIAKLQDLQQKNNPNYYAMGKLQSIAGTGENWWSSATGYKQDSDSYGNLKANRDAYLGDARTTSAATLQMLGTKLSNRTLGTVEPLSVTGNESSADEVSKKLQAQQEMANQFITGKQLTNSQGVPMNQQAIQDRVDAIKTKYGFGSEAGTYKYKGQTYTDADIAHTADQKGMTVQQVKQAMGIQ